MRHIAGDVALVLTVVAGQGKGDVGIGAGDGLGRRECRDVGAGCSAGLVGAVWTVAVFVVDLGGEELDGGVRDAGE